MNISLWLVYASIIAEYRFGVNFGQVFMDYSGNGWYGVNGDSLSVDSNDVDCTDRGIYFSGGDSRVEMPSNSKVSGAFNLPSNWSAMMWVNLETTVGIILRRADSGSGPLFFVYQDSNNKISARVKVGTIDITNSSAQGVFQSGKL